MSGKSKPYLHIVFFPDSGLCFLLGLLSAGTWAYLLNSMVRAISQSTQTQTLAAVIAYSAVAAVSCSALGYLMRNIGRTSKYRWVWLSFVMPWFALHVVGMQIEVTNAIQCAHLPVWRQSDLLVTERLYTSVAFCYGILAVALQTLWRLATRLFFMRSVAKPMSLP
ncbi:MAG TPA: hypothetical protein V6D17_03040 [Candidatus Obscuribacterales bacterium]